MDPYDIINTIRYFALVLNTLMSEIHILLRTGANSDKFFIHLRETETLKMIYKPNMPLFMRDVSVHVDGIALGF